MLKSAVAELGEQVEDDAHLGFWGVRAVLTQDPRDDLHEGVGDVRILLEDLEIDLDGALAELLALLSPLVLTDGPNKFIGELLRDLVASNLE